MIILNLLGLDAGKGAVLVNGHCAGELHTSRKRVIARAVSKLGVHMGMCPRFSLREAEDLLCTLRYLVPVCTKL